VAGRGVQASQDPLTGRRVEGRRVCQAVAGGRRAHGRAARRCWDRASSRVFDVGIQAGPPGRSFEEVTHSPATLERIARVRATLKVTVYPALRTA
jgi:hypothetical protein